MIYIFELFLLLLCCWPSNYSAIDAFVLVQRRRDFPQIKVRRYSSTDITSSRNRYNTRYYNTLLQSTVQPRWWNKRDISELPFDSSLRVLEAYHRIHGDLVIPGSFIVPSTNEYPKEWHGVKLAKHIYTMRWWQRHISQNKDRVSQLNKLSFVWERLQPRWNLFVDALGIYRNLYGDVMVPATFTVPRSNDWPKACWDLPLGGIVQRVRLRHDYLIGDNAIERKQQLDRLGFVYDVSEYKFQKFLKALKWFNRLDRENSASSQLNSAIRVPSKFVVPDNDERWPSDLWNYQLGAKCMAVRQKKLYVKGHPERKQALEDIGFRRRSGNASFGWLDVVHGAAIYSQMHGRELNVPFSFVVPAPPTENPEGCLDSWPWPERLWGLKLGQRLKDVRLKGAYLKGKDAELRRAQLDNLGFVWKPPRGRRRRGIQTEDVVEEDDDIICTVPE